MFSGIVESKGRIIHWVKNQNGRKLRLETCAMLREVKLGDSIAVNGCCLTVSALDANWIEFHVLDTTLATTSLETLELGQMVNLERSLRWNGEVGGHFVTGHIDTTGTITALEERGGDYYYEVEVPSKFRSYLVRKGSIAVDGISLTVAEVKEKGFVSWIIPHTLNHTNLAERKVGEAVHLEFDQLAKYVDKMLIERGFVKPAE